MAISGFCLWWMTNTITPQETSWLMWKGQPILGTNDPDYLWFQKRMPHTHNTKLQKLSGPLCKDTVIWPLSYNISSLINKLGLNHQSISLVQLYASLWHMAFLPKSALLTQNSSSFVFSSRFGVDNNYHVWNTSLPNNCPIWNTILYTFNSSVINKRFYSKRFESILPHMFIWFYSTLFFLHMHVHQTIFTT